MTVAKSHPVAYLRALTHVAKEVIFGEQYAITQLPFRVGRESRAGRAPIASERRAGSAAPNNDLYIREHTPQVFVSREHFQIERSQDGKFFLVDRSSTLGTWVEGRLIGSDRQGGRCELKANDVLIVGAPESGFIFKFLPAG